MFRIDVEVKDTKLQGPSATTKPHSVFPLNSQHVTGSSLRS